MNVSTEPSVTTNEQRVRAMFDAHYAFVWRTLRRLGVLEAGVDDAAQSVFLVAARRLDVIERGRERQYLFGIAHKRASEERRNASRRNEIPGEEHFSQLHDPKPSPEEALTREQLRSAIDDVLDAMDFDLRTVFALVELEGLSAPEVSTLLDIPLGTATSRLRRAREAFAAHAKRIRARMLSQPLDADKP